MTEAERVLEILKQDADTRTFAVTDPTRQQAVRHGYLLALEELAELLQDHTHDAA